MRSGSENERSIALGKTWLATCLENHSSCAKKARHANVFCTDNVHYITDLSGDGLVPSRLLAFPITAPPECNADIVKLVLSTELDEHTQYVALSHRWGLSRPVPCTLNSSVEGYTEDGLLYNDLPKTIRDSIDITRGLGFGFLWIDCLCIIQDSPEDWKNEARRMAIIYDNAVFTIAAMDAEDSTQGLAPTNGGCVGILETRGWACQERMIAPRTMMFTKGTVTWECRQATANSESSTLKEQDYGTVAGCKKHDWTPPTRPKAIFAFFRDWRLPVQEASVDVDQSDQDNCDVGSGNGNIDTLEAPTGRRRLQIWSDETPLDEIDSMLSTASSHDNSAVTVPEDSALAAKSTEDVHPDFTWSDTDPPIKIWNVPPPENSGESGVYCDHEAKIIYNYYGKELPSHIKHISSQVDFPVFGQSWDPHPDGPTSDGEDPFGRFQVDVQHLKLPEHAYYPFMRVWWNFLALYTPRNLTYDSDAFLAMNGISSTAQRWTHIRNSFGLWRDFPSQELCWYVDPDVPAVRPSTPPWIVPSWSWASTRGGLVHNAAWAACERRGAGNLMIKPVVGGATGTGFNMPLPFQAWRQSKYHEMTLKGNLRAAKIKRVRMGSGEDVFELHVEPTGRCSDHEVHIFHPDDPSEFLIENEKYVWLLLMWHFPADNQSDGTNRCLDIHLVLTELNADNWKGHYGKHTMPLDTLKDPRTMRRSGLVKTAYAADEMRDLVATINEEHWWKFVRLV